MIASIIVLDVYVPALPFDLLRPPPRPRPPVPLSDSCVPIFLVDGISTHVLGIHETLRIMYTYIYIYIYMHTHTHRETYAHVEEERHGINTRGIYMYMYVPFPTRKAYLTTINHAKFFAQFIRVADIEDTRRNAVFC